MKLSSTKAGELHEIMQQSGFTLEDYQLLKRKGWVYLQIEKDNYFSFFEDKITEIDEKTHQWKNSSTYRTKIGINRQSKVDTWKAVKSAITL